MSRRRIFKLSREPITTTRIPGGVCPACGAETEAATGTGIPRPGTITLCVYCGTFLILTPAMHLRILTDGEWLALDADHRAVLSRLRDANQWRQFRKPT